MAEARRFRMWHIGTALVIAVLSAGDTLYLRSAHKDWPEALHSAVEVALLLLVLEMLVIILLEQGELLWYAGSLFERDASPLASFETSTKEDKTFRGVLGREAVKELLHTYVLSPQRCKVRGHDQAIDSYLHFWRYLLARQKRERKAIKIQVVHSLSIEIWSDERMKQVMRMQSEFIESGGEIERILISSKVLGPDYRELVRKMHKNLVVVHFAQKNEFPHDFLFAPTIGLAVNWTGWTMASRILDVEYIVDLSDEEKKGFADNWKTGLDGSIDAKTILTSRNNLGDGVVG
jgi:hypothetical protein